MTALRLRRHQHVKSPKHFDRAFRQGNRARASQLVVAAVPNGLDCARLGLSVGKRVWKSAVRRNYVRRVFREAFRLEQARLPAGYDYVLVPAEPRLAPDLALVRGELVAMARKAVARYQEKAAREGPR